MPDVFIELIFCAGRTYRLERARAIPDSMIAAEIMARIDQLGRGSLTDTQRNEIKARLSAPPVYADAAEVEAFFKRHGAEA